MLCGWLPLSSWVGFTSGLRHYNPWGSRNYSPKGTLSYIRRLLLLLPCNSIISCGGVECFPDPCFSTFRAYSLLDLALILFNSKTVSKILKLPIPCTFQISKLFERLSKELEETWERSVNSRNIYRFK
jgi:hypothetical protein